MTCEQFNEWIGDAVDGTLSPELRDQLDAHVRTCEACRELLTDLTAIRAAAAALERFTPSPAMWSAISAKARPVAPATNWRMLAAAAALVMTLGTAVWFTLARDGGGSGAGGESTVELARSAASELQLAEQHYVNAIAALEQLTARTDTSLDPDVAAEIAQSLQSIDRAIADSRSALKAEPESFVAQTSLLEALRMKVALLQETVSLMNAQS